MIIKNQESDRIINMLDSYDELETSMILRDIVKAFKVDADRMEDLWDEYQGDTPIKYRKQYNSDKIISKLSSGMRFELVQQGVSYFTGVPIKYDIEKTNYAETQYDKIIAEINRFNKINNIADLDNDSSEYASVCGYSGRLMLVNTKGILRCMNIRPWECHFVYDSVLEELQYGFVIYKADYILDNKVQKRYVVEIYDKTTVRIYFQDAKNNYIPSPIHEPNVFPHMFNEVPLIKILNNNVETGDFEIVSELIDAYDTLISDSQDELIQYRMAILALINTGIKKEDIAILKEKGLLSLKTIDKGLPVDAKFIVKDMPVAYLKEQKDTLKQHIYKGAMAVDFADPVFQSSPESGIARLLKMMNLEGKRIIKERKFTKALNQQFIIFADYWKKKQLIFDPSDLQLQFTRNLPTDLAYYSAVVANLKETVSYTTLYDLLPFVEDPEKEFQKMILEVNMYKKSLSNNIIQSTLNNTEVQNNQPEDLDDESTGE